MVRADERNGNWFAVESKSFELRLEGKGKKTRCFITERSRGVVSWIWFGVEGMEKLVWGVEEACRVSDPASCILAWKENGRSFKLESKLNKAGRFLLCSVTDGEGKKHCLVFPEGRGFINGWGLLAEKIKGMGVKPRQENSSRRSATLDQPEMGEKSTSSSKNLGSFVGKSDLKEVVEGGKSGRDAVWVDVGDCIHGKALGFLEVCVIGRWQTQPVPYPRLGELETWLRVAWRLNEGLMITSLKEDLMLLKFKSPEEARWVLESGRRCFGGGRLQLDWWSPETGCIRSRGLVREAWIRVIGLPLHLWTPEILRKIGDACGGFVAADKVTEMKMEMKWARMLIKSEGKSRPSTVNILEGPRSYELQIWWEISPWFTGVYPAVSRVAGKWPREEDDVLSRTERRVGVPAPSCNDESLREQCWGSEKARGLKRRVGAAAGSLSSGALMEDNNGAHVVGGGFKREAIGRLSEAAYQHLGRDDGPSARLPGPASSGPTSDRRKSPAGQRRSDGLKIHRPTGSMIRIGGFKGSVSIGPNLDGPQTGPSLLKEEVKGLRGIGNGLTKARVSKGMSSDSKTKKGLGNGDSCRGVRSTMESFADPAWICARDSLLDVKDDKTSLRGTSAFESWWEKEQGEGSLLCPLMGFLHQSPGEMGCPTDCSTALVEAEYRCTEKDYPEALQTFVKESRSVTVSSNDFSPSIFSVFGRPLLSGGSSGLGESHMFEDLGETEPLRVVLADGREWGKGFAEGSMEGEQLGVGTGSPSEDPSVVNLESKGYNEWEDSCLIKFSEFLGVTTAGFEEEIVELLRKMEARQHGDKRKGDTGETRCERELRKLECTINYNGKGQIRGGRDRGNLLLKLK